jgi:hypothetical protein
VKRSLSLFLAVVLSVPLTAATPGAGAPGPSPDARAVAEARAQAAAFDALSPREVLARASGVSLAEVTGLREVDDRPGDGSLHVDLDLKTVRGSGDVLESLSIVKAPGGHRPPHHLAIPPDALFPVPFEKAKRYWFAWASRHDPAGRGRRLLRWWPEAGAPGEVAETVRDNRYAWRPQLVPEAGVFYGHRQDPRTKRWLLRVNKVDPAAGGGPGDVVWEKQLGGPPADARYMAWDVYPRQSVVELRDHAQDTRGNLFLTVVTTEDLPPDNPHGLPTEPHSITTYFDLDSGGRAAEQIHAIVHHKPMFAGDQFGPTFSEVVFRTFDLRTGGPRWERRSQWMEKGGLAAGSKAEGWLRRTERTFDPDTGRAVGEEVFRVDGSSPVKISSGAAKADPTR